MKTKLTLRSIPNAEEAAARGGARCALVMLLSVHGELLSCLVGKRAIGRGGEQLITSGAAFLHGTPRNKNIIEQT